MVRSLSSLLAFGLLACHSPERSTAVSMAPVSAPPASAVSAPEAGPASVVATERSDTAARPDAGAGLIAPAMPLTRFTLVPMGPVKPDLHLDALPARLGQKLSGYGFELGAPEPTLAPDGMDCAELLRKVTPPRGTILLLGSGRCATTQFSALSRRTATAVVATERLGSAGAHRNARLLAVVEGVVRELLGLEFPCRDGRECCAPHRASSVAEIDRRAAAGCPEQAGALDRVREASGLQ